MNISPAALALLVVIATSNLAFCVNADDRNNNFKMAAGVGSNSMLALNGGLRGSAGQDEDDVPETNSKTGVMYNESMLQSLREEHSPTSQPSSWPSSWPSESPSTPSPTGSPSVSNGPSVSPTETGQPSPQPTVPTDSPYPSPSPSEIPTMSGSPTRMPSLPPSMAPSEEASMIPSMVPSLSPSGLPTLSPSSVPSSFPSGSPSKAPTPGPTPAPVTAAPVYPSSFSVGFEYRGGVVETDGETTQSDAAACKSHCGTAGPNPQGGVSWTFYTDTNNCKCQRFFRDPEQRENANAVSGRLVPDGTPTPENCRHKCRFEEGKIGKGEVASAAACMEACPAVEGVVGYSYFYSDSSCRCVLSSKSSPIWNSSTDTVIY